jgi:hypothetical protein
MVQPIHRRDAEDAEKTVPFSHDVRASLRHVGGDAGDDGAEEGDELSFDSLGGGEDFGMD